MLPIVADRHRRVSACVRSQVVDCGYVSHDPALLIIAYRGVSEVCMTIRLVAAGCSDASNYCDSMLSSLGAPVQLASGGQIWGGTGRCCLGK